MSVKNRHEREAIAIIGMSCIFPKAPDIKAYWWNILNCVDAIGEPLPEWEARRYLDSNRIHTANGGYLKDLYRFDPGEFGIMPNSVDGGEPDQFLALRVARDALRDSGYLGDEFDHLNTGIVLGHSTYLHRGQGNLIQHNLVLDQTIELLHTVFPFLDDGKLLEARNLLESKLPQFNADIVPGLVPNVMTGRIANRLNLKGPNYLIDGACASSLLAVGAAIDELHKGQTRMMLAGGVNASLPPEVSVIFTQLGALSKFGKIRPFEKRGDGTLLGEGLGVIVMKKLSDAISDGDRIYAVVRGVGTSSDGREQSLLAPNVNGEALAVKRAYSDSGIDPASIALLEAHGTGIPLGDKTEISALKQVFGEKTAPPQSRIAVGSVKSMIGHCIPAAGIAGLIKGVLAIHHKILPPTLCETINPELGLERTPFYINTSTRPWLSNQGTPRRAGINSFGFGGINAHAILEEAPDQAEKFPSFSPWPAELCVFSAESVEALKFKLNQAEDLVRKNIHCLTCDIAAALNYQDKKEPYRLAIVIKNTEDLSKKIKSALKRLKKNRDDRWSTRTGIVYCHGPMEGRLAFLFPGEGSQYLNMFADLAICFDEVRHWFDFWRGLYHDKPGEARTDIIFPPQSELTKQHRKELEKRLYDMDVGSEAVFIAGQAMNTLLQSFGVQPDVMVGHSSGESSALAASGAIDAENRSYLAEFVRGLNTVYQRVLDEGKIPTGALLAVGALSQSVVEEQIDALNKGVVIAMDNCANQLVLFGDKASIESLKKSLSDVGGICIPLPFDRGYHTPQFIAVSNAFFEYYQTKEMKPPRVPLYSCASAELFPDEASDVRALAASQWSTTVRFRETVSNMYRDGVRYFVEVGPSGNLSAFLNDILNGKEALSLPTNQRNKNGVEQFLTVLSNLYVNGKEIKLEKLFESRSVGMEPAHNLDGIHLSNTLPVLHVNKEDRAALQKIFAVPEKQRFPVHAQDEPRADFHDMDDGSNVMNHFEDQRQMVMAYFSDFQKGNQNEIISAGENTPFLTVITEMDEQHLEAECHLCLYEDAFLKDHVLSGTVSGRTSHLMGLSCVPLMVSLEIMAEACALLAGTPAVKVIANVRALGWIALDDDELILNVRAKPVNTDLGTYRAYIFNAGTLVVSAEFSFNADRHIRGLPELVNGQSFRWEGHELYTIGMFHGPIFQTIEKINGWNNEGIEASLSTVSLNGFFDDNEKTGLVLNPVLLDSVGQLAAYWIAQQVGTDFNCFPSTIERLELYSPCPQNLQGLTLRAQQHPHDPLDVHDVKSPKSWQFECLDSRGNPLFRIRNLVNVYFSVPHRFYQFRRDPLNGWLGGPGTIAGNKDVMLWQITHLTEKFCGQSDNIFLRILANALLDFQERKEWRKLRSNIRHRREWLLGRACIKEAVRYWIFQQTGQLLYATDVTVLHNEQGAPYVDGWWKNQLIQPPEVSLAHDKRLSLVAVAPPQHFVGVDIEHIGRVQQPDLLEGALSIKERNLLNGFTGNDLKEKLLRIWCTKEAAGKYLGTGLQGNPELFEVSFLNDGWKRAHVNYAGAVVEVVVNYENESVIALATGHST